MKCGGMEYHLPSVAICAQASLCVAALNVITEKSMQLQSFREGEPHE